MDESDWRGAHWGVQWGCRSAGVLQLPSGVGDPWGLSAGGEVWAELLGTPWRLRAAQSAGLGLP